ncbi:MAG: phenylalanine--tRNA ligase subunit alpha [Treponema sp.]|jgi:phenylalanyl-tRNA synthetase alpha chain|nr:phenylalanine--tRNA ligase subunit alpha [Treponema sp.]
MDITSLHPLEVKILLFYKKDDELSIERIEKDLDFRAGNGNQALSWLLGKGLINEIRREKATFFELTEIGKQWKEKGSPEERLVELVRIKPMKLTEAAETLKISGKDAGSAFGTLAKLGALIMNAEKEVAPAPQAEQTINGRPSSDTPAGKRLALIRGLLNKGAAGVIELESLSDEEKTHIASIAKKRGAADAPFREFDRETAFFAFTDQWDATVAALREGGVTGEETNALTTEMLATGDWKGKTFRAYNVNTPPIRLIPGRTNPYAKFLEDVKDKLVSLGFEEFDGPLIETEFWNSDALFMPQFHAARDIHDVYRIAEPQFAKAIEEPWLSNVAATHENGGKTGSRGWNYRFDRDFTKRLILRSQGTVMSAKTLPSAKIPGKYFGMLRCFRYDRVDATHLSDFYQTEGIVLGEEVNLRTLLGFLEMFAVEVAGAKEVKYVPGYFPFTEPSIEVHIKHPVLGWFELGGSGIFRPEVTASLGVDVPVAAWGLGIDRMALMALGLNDLRELFSCNIEDVRLRRTA